MTKILTAAQSARRNARTHQGTSWGKPVWRKARPPPHPGRAPSGCLVLRGAGLRVHGVQRAPQSFQAAFRRAEHFEILSLVLLLPPRAPGGAMPNVGFLVHGKICQRAT